jgi:hypothetical protein
MSGPKSWIASRVQHEIHELLEWMQHPTHKRKLEPQIRAGTNYSVRFEDGRGKGDWMKASFQSQNGEKVQVCEVFKYLEQVESSSTEFG